MSWLSGNSYLSSVKILALEKLLKLTDLYKELKVYYYCLILIYITSWIWRYPSYKLINWSKLYMDVGRRHMIFLGQRQKVLIAVKTISISLLAVTSLDLMCHRGDTTRSNGCSAHSETALQLMKPKFEGRSTFTASRKQCLFWFGGRSKTSSHSCRFTTENISPRKGPCMSSEGLSFWHTSRICSRPKPNSYYFL